jgi:hypothetical protein
MGDNNLALGGQIGHVDEVLRDPNSDEACLMDANAYPAADLMESSNGTQHPVRDRQRKLHAVNFPRRGRRQEGSTEGGHLRDTVHPGTTLAVISPGGDNGQSATRKV